MFPSLRKWIGGLVEAFSQASPKEPSEQHHTIVLKNGASICDSIASAGDGKYAFLTYFQPASKEEDIFTLIKNDEYHDRVIFFIFHDEFGNESPRRYVDVDLGKDAISGQEAIRISFTDGNSFSTILEPGEIVLNRFGEIVFKKPISENTLSGQGLEPKQL